MAGFLGTCDCGCGVLTPGSLVHFVCGFSFFGYVKTGDLNGCSNGLPTPQTRYLARKIVTVQEWTDDAGNSGSWTITNLWRVNRWTGEETVEWGSSRPPGTHIISEQTSPEIFEDPYEWNEFIAACDRLYQVGSSQIIELLRAQNAAQPGVAFSYSTGLTFNSEGEMTAMAPFNDTTPFASRIIYLTGSDVFPFPNAPGKPCQVSHASATVVRAGTLNLRRSRFDVCTGAEYGVSNQIISYPAGVVELTASSQEYLQLLEQ